MGDAFSVPFILSCRPFLLDGTRLTSYGLKHAHVLQPYSDGTTPPKEKKKYGNNNNNTGNNDNNSNNNDNSNKLIYLFIGILPTFD